MAFEINFSTLQVDSEAAYVRLSDLASTTQDKRQMFHLGTPYSTPTYCEILGLFVQRSGPIFQAAEGNLRKGKLSSVQFTVLRGLISETGDCHTNSKIDAYVSASHIASAVEINMHRITAVTIACCTCDSGDGIAPLTRQTNGTERTSGSFLGRLHASLLVL